MTLLVITSTVTFLTILQLIKPPLLQFQSKLLLQCMVTAILHLSQKAWEYWVSCHGFSYKLRARILLFDQAEVINKVRRGILFLDTE